MSTLVEEWKDQLPWQFKHKPVIDSIISSVGEQFTILEDVNYDLKYNLDVDTATGKNLDRIGDIVGITRLEAYSLMQITNIEDMTDEVYRKVLQFQILKNNTSGTYEDIMKGLHLLWGDEALISYAENPVVSTYNGAAWDAPDPATVQITMEDVSTDSVDPSLIKPMVIRAAGVKLLFSVSYRDPINLDDWDRFTNLVIWYRIWKQYNGIVQYDGSEIYGTSESAYLGLEYNTYEGDIRYSGTEMYGPKGGQEEEDTVDAVILNQAKQKLLRHRALGEDYGESMKIAYFAWGTGLDSDGSPYEPDGTETELRNEVYRTELYYKESDSGTYTYWGVIPSDECNGEYISELGLVDEDGMLICIKTFEKKEKPTDIQMVFGIDDCVDLS